MALVPHPRPPKKHLAKRPLGDRHGHNRARSPFKMKGGDVPHLLGWVGISPGPIGPEKKTHTNYYTHFSALNSFFHRKALLTCLARAGNLAPGPLDGPRSGLVRLRLGLDLPLAARIPTYRRITKTTYNSNFPVLFCTVRATTLRHALFLAGGPGLELVWRSDRDQEMRTTRFRPENGFGPKFGSQGPRSGPRTTDFV